LDPDRRKDDLLQFDAVHRRISEPNAYIALWIVDGDQHCVQREAFGHAYYDGERLIGRFINNNEQATMMVGGFYVLARSRRDGHNPFSFVTLREFRVSDDTYPAKITSWQKNEAWFGSVDMARNVAGGVDYKHRAHKIDGPSDPGFFNDFVFILKKSEDRQPHQPLIGGHRPVVEETSYQSPPDELPGGNREEKPQQVEKEEEEEQKPDESVEQPEQEEKAEVEEKPPMEEVVDEPEKEAAIEQEDDGPEIQPETKEDAADDDEE